MSWLFRETYTSRWFHARLDRFLAKITQFGLSADHVRCSHLAVRKKFQADGRACSTLDLAPFNPEYAVTTDALVATTTTIMLSRMAEESSESLNARGRALLKAVVYELVTELAYFEFQAGHEEQYGIVAGRTLQFVTRGGARPRGLADARCSLSRPVELVEALLLLTDMSRRRSKCSFWIQAGSALRLVTSMISSEAELKLGSPAFNTATHVSLPRMGSSRRSRRVAPAMKRVASQMVADTEGVTKVGQLVACTALLQRPLGRPTLKRRRTGVFAGGKSASSWCFTNSVNYIYSQRFFMRGAQDVSGIIVDDSRIGCRDYTHICGVDPARNVGMWLIPQAPRETRRRLALPGSAVDELERDTFLARTDAFFRTEKTKANPVATAKARAKVVRNTAERKATFMMMCDVENSLIGSWGKDLSAWIPMVRPWDEDMAPGDEIPPLLVINMDQCSKNTCMAFFLEKKVRASVWCMWGNFHRRSNDVERAMALSGMIGTAYRAVGFLNVLFGAWGGGSFFRQVQETAIDIPEYFHENDKLVMLFWPSVCFDRGYAEADECDASARRRWLDTIPLCRSAVSKGRSCSLKKWFSIILGLKEADRDWHTELFVMTVACIMNGFELDWDALHTSAIFDAMAKKALEVGPLPRPAGSSADAPLVVVPKSVKQQIRAAVEEKQKLFGKSANTFHVATKYMMDIDLCYSCRRLSIFGAPVQEEHSKWKEENVSPDASVRFLVDCATGGAWVESLRRTIGLLKDRVALRRSGLSVDIASARATPPSESRLAVEDAMAAQIFSFVANLLTERSGSMLQYARSYPHALCGLLQASRDGQAACLAMFCEDWKAYETARRLALPDLRKIVERSPTQSRVMEDFARMARAGGWSLGACGALLSRVKKAAMCFAQENIIETSFRGQRDAETRGNPCKSMRHWKVYERLQTSDLIRLFGMQPLEPNVDIPIGTEAKIEPSDEFLFSRRGSSPNHELLRQLCGKQDWVSTDAQGLNKHAADIEALRTLLLRDDFTLASALWQNLLIPKHQVILVHGAGVKTFIAFTLRVTDSGVCCWPVRRIGNHHIQLGDSADSAPFFKTFVHVDKDLFVVPTKVRSLLHVAAGSPEIRLDEVAVALDHTKQVPLLRWQASHGFANVPESAMQRAHELLALECPDYLDKLISAADHLALSLTRSLLPDLPEAEAQEIMHLRMEMETEPSLKDNFDEAVDTEVLLDVGAKDDHKAASEYKAEREKAKHHHQRRRAAVDGLIVKSYGSKKAPKPAKLGTAVAAYKIHTKTGAERWWSTVFGDTSFIEQALPAVAKVFTDHANGRWRLQYGARDKSFSWAQRGVQRAATMVLCQAWEWHTEAIGEQPPKGVHNLLG